MRSSNPALGRLSQAVVRERGAGSGYGIYPSPTGYAPERAAAMTLDDVVIRTVALLLLTGLAGAFGWAFLDGPLAVVTMIGSMIAGLVLVLVISFMTITNPWIIGAYAVSQGLLLGVVSRIFENQFNGIVVQALVGTFAVFAGMAVLYKARILRATPKFTRFVLGALIGVVALSFLNLAVYLFGGDLGLIDYGVTGPKKFLPIVFTLACVAVGALTFILDFDAVEQGVRAGLPEKYAWYCAFGILVGLVYLYWQVLRLLGYLRR